MFSSARRAGSRMASDAAIWLVLCNDQKREKTIIKSYFRDYVESSRITRPALGDGDDEGETIQTITCTKTVILHWKSLVAEADNTILREKRRDDPSKRGLWKLRWDKGESPLPPTLPRQQHRQIIRVFEDCRTIAEPHERGASILRYMITFSVLCTWDPSELKLDGALTVSSSKMDPHEDGGLGILRCIRRFRGWDDL
ncbi:hypothetical protein B0T24DRAFT_266189 [Lasiosphaeria ovina]|uniref:Uncharacterized protein n=1 Tax=Lasiosphaeria ovina TaxID=92902 RepID=A0AAE0KCK4_9PEZI|nr:hypothetical protein B0T24DRAFT_266189 [Lasiosphaeria ovina]